MSNDSKIKQYRKAVEAKRKQLGPKPKLAYTTNALLDLNGQKVNLNTLGDEEQCVGIVGQLLTAQDVVGRANDALGTSVELKFGGFTVDQWIADIKLRVSLIAWERKKRQLTAMDSQLAALRSDDAKTSDAIADIVAQLED